MNSSGAQLRLEFLMPTSSSVSISSGTTSSALGSSTSGYTVPAGYTEILLSGGTTTSTYLGPATSELILGGIASNTQVSSGGSLIVSSGGGVHGSSLSAIISSGGSATIAAGGVDSSTIINGGAAAILSGGVATGTVIVAGTETVSAGGTDNGATVDAAAHLIISSGALVSALAVQAAANVTLLSGAVLTGTVSVANGGLFTSAVFVSSGGLISSFGSATSGYTATAGWTAYAEGFGSTTSTTLSSGTLEIVTDAGAAYNTQIKNGGTLEVAFSATNGTSWYAAVSSGGELLLSAFYSGAPNEAIGEGDAVLSGGTEIILNQAAEFGGTISSGGNLVLSNQGSAQAEIIEAGGIVTISSGGTGYIQTIYGAETVLSGGEAKNNTIASGGVQTLDGGNASGTTIQGGGAQIVESGSTDNNVTVSSGGTLVISSGGAVSGVLLSSGGMIELLAGGSLTGVSLGAGASLGVDIYVSSGNFISAIGNTTTAYAVSAGFAEVVLAGGTTTSTLLRSTTSEVIAGGTASITTISSGGTLIVSSGGIATASLVLTGGVETVSSAGTETSGTLSAGTQTVQSGGLTVSENIKAAGTQTIAAGGSAYAELVSGGTVYDYGLLSGGLVSAAGTQLGVLVVESGGIASGVTVTGGLSATGPATALVVSAGGIATSVTISLINGNTSAANIAGLLSNSTETAGNTNVLSGGQVIADTVNNAGLEVLSGGGASALLVFSNGHVDVSAGGTISGAVISPTGALNFNGNATLNGAIADSAAVAINAGTVTGAGTLYGSGALSIAAGATDLLLAGGTIGLAGAFTDAGTLSVGAGAVAGISSFSGAGTINVASGGVLGLASLASTGTISIAAGGIGTLGNGSAGAVLDSGTVNIAGSFTTPVNMEGNGAKSVLDFTGTADATSITNFGTLDDIIIGSSLLPIPSANAGIVLNYAAGALTVTETSAAGASIGSAVIQVAGVSALSAGSFEAFYGANGVNIELVAGNTNSNFIFFTAGTGAFDAGSNFVGGLSPGNNVKAGENVTIAGGTAALSGTVANAGSITIASAAAIADTATLTGAGTLSVGAGGLLLVSAGGIVSGAILTSAASLNIASGGTAKAVSVTNAATVNVSSGGTLNGVTLNGAGAAVELAAGAAVSGYAYVGSGDLFNALGTNITGNATVNGTGLFGIFPGAGITIAGGNIAKAVDLGSLTITGSFTNQIYLAGNLGETNIYQVGSGGNAVVDFAGTSDAGTITNFGSTDDIILGSNILPIPSAGAGILLSYSGTTLTVTETNAAGMSLASTHLLVSLATLDSAVFENFYGTNGINIELAASNPHTGFTFTTTGAFAAGSNFSGGLSPGNTIAATESVTIASGTAALSGTVTDAGLLSIASGAAVTVAGKFSDAGTITGAGALSVASGGTLAITAGHSAILSGALTDTGLIAVASGGVVSAAGTIAGAGNLSIASGGAATIGGFGSNTVTDDGTLNVIGSLAVAGTNIFTSAVIAGSIDMTGTSNGVVTFSGASSAELITLASVTDFAVGDSIILGTSLISGLKAGDAINVSESGNQLNIADYTALANSASESVIRFNISGAGGAAIGLGTGNPHLVVSSVSGVGYVITDVPCFAAGTRILSTQGEIAVEHICQGDTLITALNRTRGTSHVIWTGQRSIDIARNPRPETVLPVRITAHAFGPGVPKRDLRLSPHHAVYIDGHFFQAIDLVNGSTIFQEKATKSVVYYHIELESHNVILAENLPSESFMDYDNRFMFEDPFAPIPLTLLPAFGPKGDAGLCAPLVRDGARLCDARAKLLARADELAALQPARSA